MAQESLKRTQVLFSKRRQDAGSLENTSSVRGSQQKSSNTGKHIRKFRSVYEPPTALEPSFSSQTFSLNSSNS